ncbi:hypothetical protein [Bacillus alkalicellulosilyticus]|uniref:hypothetical protein n=1 Tax=Alkalihalobacterium alkalicellulosilyticum TaxID=1912214 RepID=UPI000998034C|nr:hypothetical protein [Bacillus alkalicellulosilyticus]
MNWKTYEKETIENPKMLEVYLEQAWQDAFCYAMAVEEPEKNYLDPKLLLTIISGNDASLQAIKAAIDIGSNGLYFGYGEKGLTGYEFQREFKFCTDKGAYEKFPITINQNRKALVIVHDSLLGDNEFILSFDGDPAEDIRQVLGGGKYGLHVLPEWKDTVYTELLNRGFIQEVEFYKDSNLLPGFEILKLSLEEEDADSLISELVKTKKLSFPREGNGSALEEVTDLTSYMGQYVNDMIEKVSEQVEPTHNPMTDSSFPYFEQYKRPLFPVQAHVSTAVAKRLKEQKSLIIQGEMRCDTFTTEKVVHTV